VDGDNGLVSYANKGRAIETNLEHVSPKTGNLVYLVRSGAQARKKDTAVALQEYYIELDKALDLTVKGIARMFSKITYVDCFWPNPSNTGYSAFLGDYIKGLHRAISAVEEKGVSAEDFAHLFKTPTCIYRIFVRIARAREHLSKDQRVYLSKRLLSAVDVLKSDEPFDGTSNRRMSEESVKEYVNAHNFLPMSGDRLRDKISRLNFLLWNYAETLYWTRWSTGFDFEGPHRINEEQGDHMVIRDGFELRPVELWPQLENFPYVSMKVATVYRGVGDFQIDPYGHLTHSGNLRNAAIFYHFSGETKDGQGLESEGDIDEALKVFPAFIDRNASFIQSFDVRERVLKQAEIEWYILRDVFKYAGMDWRPPLEVQQRIMSEDFKENLILLKDKNQTDEERYKHYSKALDPRL
ncbi:MAG TPA: hypothetical protein VJA18_01220, partial [Candidatus Nanoarchaeia archaeon]|nr:hypothetical protein [Candidatus Nanoarchaeia archaeon]